MSEGDVMGDAVLLIIFFWMLGFAAACFFYVLRRYL